MKTKPSPPTPMEHAAEENWRKVRDLRRKNHDLKKYSAELHSTVKAFVTFMDRVMKEPSTNERGQKIAKAVNALDMDVQRLERFGLRKYTREWKLR